MHGRVGPHTVAMMFLNFMPGSYRSWKTWKAMEFIISSSRAGKSVNFSAGHGKLWKSNVLSEKKRQTGQKIEKNNR